MKQYTFNGKLEEWKEPEKPQRPPKYVDMQKKWGLFNGKKCHECKYFEIWDYHNKTYFKCELKGTSHSTATDIRKYANACGKFVGEESEQ